MASISSATTGTLAVSGLASGLDTAAIIDGLLATQKNRIQLLQAKQAGFQQQQAAFKGVEAKLLALRSASDRLNRLYGGVFQARTAASSDEGVLTAAASSSAEPGTYTLRVADLARAHQVASQGFASRTSRVTQGTFQIGAGAAAKTVTVDAGNDTLDGLARAINAAGAGVRAAVVNDGRSAPYRLVLTSEETGRDAAILIVNGLAADSGDAARPDFASTYIGQAAAAPGFAGTSTAAANAGAGGYTGEANNTYRLTVVTGGQVGADDGIQLAYADGTGANAGTITVNSGDADAYLDLAQGVRVKFSAGTLVAGDELTVEAYVPTVQGATDAAVQLGSGPGALTIRSGSNRLSEVFPGLTLDLKQADPAKEVSVTVARDVTGVRQAVLDFVTAYNDFNTAVNGQVAYDPQSGSGGPLLGNRDVLTIQDQIRRVATDVVGGLGTLNRLSVLGIKPNDKGGLDVDQGRLDDVLAGKAAGVSLDDVPRLFALTGASTGPDIQFISGSIKTKASASAYRVDITQVATQASVTAANAAAASTVIDATNDTLTLKLDGRDSGTLTLAHGTYTRAQLALALQAQLDRAEALAGRRVDVTVDVDRLKLTSAAYGSGSEVTLTGGTALTALGFAGTEAARGTDVAGSFIVNGVAESAVGTGQFLQGASGNANTADLQVRVLLTADRVVAGPEADLTVTQGIAARLALAFDRLLDPVSGRLHSIDRTYQSNIDDVQKSIDRQNQLLQSQRDALTLQFVTLEATISQLKSTGDFLTNQFASLQGFSGSNNKR